MGRSTPGMYHCSEERAKMAVGQDFEEIGGQERSRELRLGAWEKKRHTSWLQVKCSKTHDEKPEIHMSTVVIYHFVVF